MTGRVLVIVPSRGRSARLAGMLDEALTLSAGLSDFAVCTDDDDADQPGYEALRDLLPPGRVLWFTGRRRPMCAWTNWVTAHPRACRYEFLASLGDDHVPRTQDWDAELTTAIGGGAGIAYGDDLHQGAFLPTAPVISRAITDALGWMCLTGLESKFCDNVWKLLGEGAGCLHWVPGVTIEHVHPDARKAVMDETYVQGYSTWPGDERVFRLWEKHGLADDIRTVQRVMARRATVTA